MTLIRIVAYLEHQDNSFKDLLTVPAGKALFSY